MNKKVLLAAVILLLTGCSFAPKKPSTIENACTIANTHASWKKAFIQTYKKYGVPPHVVMAIIYYESHFRHDARPPRKKSWLFFRGDHISTAYGYAQALDGTWADYKKSTGKRGADRDYLPDAVDFIGWYVNNSNRVTGVSKWDARNQYLAYHEGAGGYKRQSYNKKPWLLKVANRVGKKAERYKQQLIKCN